MGYVFTHKDTIAYERQRSAFHAMLEIHLLLQMLKPRRGESVLDIGCGTGMSTLPFVQRGLHATGLDPSPHMLAVARQNLGDRVDFHRGFAEDLPFEDNSFNHACFFTSLEFTNDPRRAIEEACRVAKDRVFIGVLNRYAISGVQERIRGIFTESIFNRAQFFSIWELKQIVREILGDPPIRWRTVIQFPAASGKIAHSLERSSIVQKCPLGTFIGMVFAPVPRFKATPLLLTYPAHPVAGPGVAGFARNLKAS